MGPPNRAPPCPARAHASSSAWVHVCAWGQLLGIPQHQDDRVASQEHLAAAAGEGSGSRGAAAGSVSHVLAHRAAYAAQQAHRPADDTANGRRTAQPCTAPTKLCTGLGQRSTLQNSNQGQQGGSPPDEAVLVDGLGGPGALPCLWDLQGRAGAGQAGQTTQHGCEPEEKLCGCGCGCGCLGSAVARVEWPLSRASQLHSARLLSLRALLCP
jgi:hypothetical protein